MSTNKSIEDAINNNLRAKLDVFNCGKGRFQCSSKGCSLSLYGIKRDSEKSVSFWEWENPIKKLIREYFELFISPNISFTIDINLDTNLFSYKNVSQKEFNKNLKKEKLEKEKEDFQRFKELKKQLSLQTETYGLDFAKKIAEALRPDTLIAHGHRDYCGMGIGMNAKNEYIYGSVWDGLIIDVERIFSKKEKFIKWLSWQSDASLANLNSDKFYVGNQVITKKRLENFLS